MKSTTDKLVTTHFSHFKVQYCCEQFDGIYFPRTTSNGFYCSLRPTYYHSAIYFLLYQ